jgi:hypothetical protein
MNQIPLKSVKASMMWSSRFLPAKLVSMSSWMEQNSPSSSLQPIDGLNKVFGGAPEAVNLPHHERISWPQTVHHLRKARAV